MFKIISLIVLLVLITSCWSESLNSVNWDENKQVENKSLKGSGKEKIDVDFYNVHEGDMFWKESWFVWEKDF